jgi:hypothetical protein
VAYNASGEFREALDAIREARERLGDLSRPSYLLQLDARVQMAAAVHFLGQNPGEAESELRACYDVAINSGFTLSALNIAVYLATFCRLRGATHVALELMDSLLAVCDRVSTSRTKAIFYGSFATMLSSSGQTSLAHEMLSRAMRSTLPAQPDLEGQLHLTSSRAKIAGGSPLEAIDASAKAQILFAELGRTGLIGVSLHLRSLALIALGRYNEALYTAMDAVDALALGHPQARRLAKETVASLRGGRFGYDRGY